ncbi:MAG: aldehyde dehydrogenase family protein [Polyangiaceae bacterium]|nr:aldehyde dehydrogenase family protein [Polyangiaceae bacterium]
MRSQTLTSRGNYLGGELRRPPDFDAELVSLDPHSGEPVGRLQVSLHDVERAVTAASDARRAWRETELATRIAAVQRVAKELEARGEELARRITREVGKPLWEARTEVKAAIAKVGVSVEEGLALVREVTLEDGSSYAPAPHGVLAVLGPFNFPLHLMHGHVVPALLMGNTVVLKPSEVAPFVGELYAEVMHAAGLPAGVFNLVQGGAEVGAALAAHPGVQGVLFTGSYRAGLAIQRATLEQPGKLLALEMGGKNPALVLADAPLDKALHDVAWGAYVTTGQRCSGTALCLVERPLLEAVQAGLTRMLPGIRVGDPFSEVFMGPLATAGARAALETQLAAARSAGVEQVASSEAPSGAAYAPATLHRVEQFDSTQPYLTEELFGPDLTLMPIDDLEHGIEIANALPYGLSASVFTASASRFEWARGHLEYGCINHNAPTPGASSRLPFGGVKQSGNHRPAALWSSLYCSYPVATLRGGTTRPALSPGLDW